jgi:16S rRNA (guanine527-N7)-methyltransferase
VTADSDGLVETLRDAQRLGFLGSRPIEQAVAHTQGFVDALGLLPPGTRLIDIGSGGGLPGLVLADRYRDASITLVDRRQKRTDFLQRAVVRLGLLNVEVRCADVERLSVSVASGVLAPFDVVTARGFGPPDVTLRYAVGLLASPGTIAISEPPVGDRWDPSMLVELGVTSERRGGVRVFQR